MRMTNWLAQHIDKFLKGFTNTIDVWRRLLSRSAQTRHEAHQGRRIMNAASSATCLLMCMAVLSNFSLAADDAHLAWDRALVVLRGGRNTTMREAAAARDFDKVPPGTPTVLYLHGSTGMTPHDPTQFGKAGFLVIGPDSMARANRPVNRTLPNNVASFPQAQVTACKRSSLP